MLVSPEHPENAPLPMHVTALPLYSLGMTISELTMLFPNTIYVSVSSSRTKYNSPCSSFGSAVPHKVHIPSAKLCPSASPSVASHTEHVRAATHVASTHACPSASPSVAPHTEHVRAVSHVASTHVCPFRSHSVCSIISSPRGSVCSGLDSVSSGSALHPASTHKHTATANINIKHLKAMLFIKHSSFWQFCRI